ncbi:unnamed protein product [Amoebophrya sp. A120]|nr:unnamed protein product [Amoebophrya sp. A120]|eukprot:GSA120T00000375001.1
MSKYARLLRRALDTECVAVPGAFCGLAGRIAAEKGFKAAYVSGAALTASAGVPDIGVLTLDHFTARIKEITLASGLPLICDADTGFGEAEMVTRTTVEYIHAGAACLHIEDQVFPKRCGHLKGKSLIPCTEMVEKVERAVAASKKHSDGEFLICARTDARGVVGMEDAVARATAYVAAGAEMIFPEGLQTREEFQEFSTKMKNLPKPPYLLANMTEFGQTPYVSVADFEKMGYHCVIFPVSTLRCAMQGVQQCLEVLQDREATLEQHTAKMFSRQELYDSLGYIPGVEWSYPDTTLERQGK